MRPHHLAHRARTALPQAVKKAASKTTTALHDQESELHDKIGRLSQKTRAYPGCATVFDQLERQILEESRRHHQTVDEYLDDLMERARHLAQAHANLIDFAATFVRQLGSPATRQEFARSVLIPARQGRLSSEEACRGTDRIFGRDVRAETAQKAPGWSIGLGIGVGLGALCFGGQGAMGIAMQRSQKALAYYAIAGEIGAEDEVSGQVQCIIVPGHPSNFGGGSVGGALGAEFYAGLAVGVAQTLPGRALDSISVAIPFGFGIEVGATLEYCVTAPLR
ncbi:MAG TPA: hypothetical protein VNH46_05900 [Gemmatimonadales bacterium]|nr:hypothetical protein [Gemmatimonadales bacterium]